MESGETDLRYISASRVETPAGLLGELDVFTGSAAGTCKVEGIVVDPRARRVRFFVLNSGARVTPRRYLVPMAASRLDARQKALQIDVEPAQLDSLGQSTVQDFPPFSDDDLITALFASNHAA